MSNTIRLQLRNLAIPASLIIFVSANIVNAGNLLFNLVFSRLMGPEIFSELAFLLTLKLSILGILNAVQMFVTDEVARTPKRLQSSFIARFRSVTMWNWILATAALPVLALLMLGLNVVDLFHLSSAKILMIFLLGTPFYLPLAIWRGVAQGRIDLSRIVTSANVEMIVRLLGGFLLWHLGFGIEGVIFAFVLSLFAAWYCAKPIPVTIIETEDAHEKIFKFRKILPWAAMQLSIVLALDGDVFVAKILMTSENAGYIAALSLVQRIIFFASFALASLLLPQVISAIENHQKTTKFTLPIFAIVILSGIFVTLICWQFDELVAKTLFGAQFLAISPYLVYAALSATIATINYFLVTYLLAQKLYPFAYLYLFLSLSQLVFLQLFYTISDGDVLFFVAQKLGFQLFSFLMIISAIFVNSLRRRNRLA